VYCQRGMANNRRPFELNQALYGAYLSRESRKTAREKGQGTLREGSREQREYPDSKRRCICCARKPHVRERELKCRLAWMGGDFGVFSPQFTVGRGGM
jgi:hypothetical protein